MALTRRALKAMGIDEEKIDEIISMHSETVDGLKADVAKYKADAEKLPGVQKELNDLKAAGDDGWEQKAKDWEKKFKDLEAENKNKETRAAKETAYRELLKAAGISEKRLESVLKVTDLEKVQLEDGKLKDADKLTASVKEEWADFIVKTETTGASTSQPPANGSGGNMTKEQILGIKDGSARRKAMAENPQLFGLPTNQN